MGGGPSPPHTILCRAALGAVIAANMNDLARYALICQAEGLVPIVEPDISMSGGRGGIEEQVGKRGFELPFSALLRLGKE